MIFTDSLLMAAEAINRNKLRSFLTALGIIIGVGSVVAMVQLGEAATESITAEISSMGSNLLYVMPGTSRRGFGGAKNTARSLETSDAEAIKREISDVIVAPATQASSTVIFRNANDTISVTGSTNEYFEVRNHGIDYGRTFSDEEIQAGAAVCIIGRTVIEDLYFDVEPLGTTLRLGATACEVIGVLEEKGESMGNDQDKTVVMPLKAVQRRLLGDLDIRTIYVSIVSSDVTAKQKEIEALLRRRRGIRENEEDDFHVRNMQSIADALSGTTRTLTALLGAIAAVSLLVGGIGIMNIMLVSVTERTREIGIRLAVGARSSDVRLQFLIEAIMLSTLGGLIGLVVGVGGSYLAIQQLGLPFIPSPTTMLVGFSFSAIIGIVFGYFPARKASQLNPIEALRHE